MSEGKAIVDPAALASCNSRFLEPHLEFRPGIAPRQRLFTDALHSLTATQRRARGGESFVGFFAGEGGTFHFSFVANEIFA